MVLVACTAAALCSSAGAHTSGGETNSIGSMMQEAVRRLTDLFRGDSGGTAAPQDVTGGLTYGATSMHASRRSLHQSDVDDVDILQITRNLVLDPFRSLSTGTHPILPIRQAFVLHLKTADPGALRLDGGDPAYFASFVRDTRVALEQIFVMGDPIYSTDSDSLTYLNATVDGESHQEQLPGQSTSANLPLLLTWPWDESHHPA